MSDRTGISRRAFLAMGGAGTFGLASCIGDDDPEPVDEGGNGDGGSDRETTLRMRTPTSTAAAYAANQRIAATVNDDTEQVFVEAQTSPGTKANIGALYCSIYTDIS